MIVVNLTQHSATADQLAAGVIEPSPEDKSAVQALLTFEKIPSTAEMGRRAVAITEIARKYSAYAMIGGAPFFMGKLENELIFNGFTPLYAFSVRESVEETTEDGSVVKKNIFKHEGFVRV